jgi:dihydroxyacid dehydratase/phosphogluconate dehydratase
MVYGGTIHAGTALGKPRDIISAFQSYGEYLAGVITDEQRIDIVQHACPGAGACGGMYTANTMAVAIEALGLSLPYSSSLPAESDGKADECRRAGAERLWLEVRESNAGARAAYARLGFRPMGVRPGYYPAARGQRESAVVMSLDIDLREGPGDALD